MRLADFILSNTGPILDEWDEFARSIWPVADPAPAGLRDHGEEILRWIAGDMTEPQSETERSRKSKGRGGAPAPDRGSATHAITRAEAGLDLMTMVSEYRALRASVLRLWAQSRPDPDQRHLEDLTRFNEAIDQSLSEAIASYHQHLEQTRHLFLSILGHDLRNPLNAIMITAEELLENASVESGQAESVSQLITSGRAMERLLADLLEFATRQLGRRIPAVYEAADLGEIAAEVVKECLAACTGRRILVSGTGNLSGHWDRSRLRQLFSNLIANALVHGSETDVVELRLQDFGPSVEIRIHNDGPPIPEELLARIFDPLVHGPSSRKNPGSLGLGLYVVR